MMALISAVLILGGLAVLAGALSRWGKPGMPSRRVGALSLLGLGAVIAGSGVLAGGSTPTYVVSLVAATLGGALLLTSAARTPARPRPRLRRRW